MKKRKLIRNNQKVKDLKQEVESLKYWRDTEEKYWRLKLGRLTKAIHSIACAHESDYPDIKTSNPLEQLYAISSGYEGTSLANKDLWDFIKLIREEFKISEETFDLLTEKFESQGGWKGVLK